jgi:KDO2-lipid IV(A) lauroyltransferase
LTLAGLALVRALALVRDFLLACLAVVVFLPLWWLPWRAAAALGRLYGYVAYVACPLARRAGTMNLRRACGPVMTRSRARRAVLTVFGNLGESVAEGLQFARRFKRGSRGWDRFVVYEDPEIERRVLDDPRPKIFVTGHLGSWEVAVGLAAVRTGRRGAVVARRVDNPFLNAAVRQVRLGASSEWIEKSGAAAASQERLGRGESVAMLIDENGGPRGLFVEFFGRPASTRKTPAVLSLKTGAPIVLGACVRRGGDRRLVHRLAIFEPGLESTDPGAAIRDLTTRVLNTYEGWIRDDPLQWRWIHWRWKSRPDGSEERYTRRDLEELFGRDAVGASVTSGPFG